MHYEVRSGKTIYAQTDHIKCMDPRDIQKAMIEAGYKVYFTGTEAEYEAASQLLEKRVHLNIAGPRKGEPRMEAKAIAEPMDRQGEQTSLFSDAGSVGLKPQKRPPRRHSRRA